MLFCVLSPQPSAGPGNQAATPSEVSTSRLRTDVLVRRLLAFHVPLITSCIRVPMTLQEEECRCVQEREDRGERTKTRQWKVQRRERREGKWVSREGNKGIVAGRKEMETKGYKVLKRQRGGSYGSWECVHGRIWISRCIVGDLLRRSILYGSIFDCTLPSNCTKGMRQSIVDPEKVYNCVRIENSLTSIG